LLLSSELTPWGGKILRNLNAALDAKRATEGAPQD
jgi:hypothetical protein